MDPLAFYYTMVVILVLLMNFVAMVASRGLDQDPERFNIQAERGESDSEDQDVANEPELVLNGNGDVQPAPNEDGEAQNEGQGLGFDLHREQRPARVGDAVQVVAGRRRGRSGRVVSMRTETVAVIQESQGRFLSVPVVHLAIIERGMNITITYRNDIIINYYFDYSC